MTVRPPSGGAKLGGAAALPGATAPKAATAPLLRTAVLGHPKTAFEPSAPDPKIPRNHTVSMRLEGEDVDISWREYGNPNAQKVTFCVHGYTRNKADFDFLGEQEGSGDTRVIAVDVVGRGDSSRFQSSLTSSKKYTFDTYADQMQQLFQHLSLQRKDVTWVGTSMGGIIGLHMAAKPNTPIQRLVLNDIGPEVSTQALKYLARTFTGDNTLSFNSVDDATAYFKERMHGFGTLPDSTWRHIAESSIRLDPKGDKYVLNYDPKITESFRILQKARLFTTPFHWKALSMLANLGLRELFDQVDARILVLHGEDSPVLTPAILSRMVAMKPEGQLTVQSFPGIGHAPSLMVSEQVNVITRFKQRHPARPFEASPAQKLLPTVLRALVPRPPTTKSPGAYADAIRLTVTLPWILRDVSTLNTRAAEHGPRKVLPGEPQFLQEGSAISGPYETQIIDGRAVRFQTPPGPPPLGGFPTALLLTGSGFSARTYFYNDGTKHFGADVQPYITKMLLENGFAVVAPENLIEATAFDPNTPLGLLGQASPDHQFMEKLFAEIDKGNLGPLSRRDLSPVGLSSGGFETSALLESQAARMPRGGVVCSAGHYLGTPWDAYAPRDLPSNHGGVLLLHAKDDGLVPFNKADAYAKALRARGVFAEVVAAEHGGHGWPPNAPELIRKFLLRDRPSA